MTTPDLSKWKRCEKCKEYSPSGATFCMVCGKRFSAKKKFALTIGQLQTLLVIITVPIVFLAVQFFLERSAAQQAAEYHQQETQRQEELRADAQVKCDQLSSAGYPVEECGWDSGWGEVWQQQYIFRDSLFVSEFLGTPKYLKLKYEGDYGDLTVKLNDEIFEVPTGETIVLGEFDPESIKFEKEYNPPQYITISEPNPNYSAVECLLWGGPNSGANACKKTIQRRIEVKP